tara:strand:+ start:10632 stop:10955 length:324 start_codon:yes stop_codon:yes gene_type:complete
MPTVIYRTAACEETALDLKAGTNVMEGAVTHGIDGIVGECGGALMCATCHVYLSEADFARLPPRSEVEEEMLDSAAAERRATSRLSCQIKMTDELDGLVVEIPDSQY